MTTSAKLTTTTSNPWAAVMATFKPLVTTTSNTGTTITLTYDQNGNVTGYKPSSLSTTTYAWDWRNRMTQSVATTTTNYAYDQNDSRVLMSTSTGGTVYPFTFYNLATSTGTSSVIYKQIYANGELVATIKGSTTTAQVYYVHPDHLGSINVISNAQGTIEQELGYYPYGSQRVSKKLSGFNESRRYIGQEYDPTTALNYLNARYYDNSRGEFLSEDPVFLGAPNQQSVSDPQSLNSYSYANGNPITGKDPSGKCPWCLIPIATAVGALGGLGQQGLSDAISNYTTYGTNFSAYHWSPAKDYLYSAGAGAALGFAASTGAYFGLGAATLAGIAGGGSVISDVTRDISNQVALNNPWEIGRIAIDGLVAAGTDSLVRLTPGVGGAKPNLFTTAFFSGAHTQNIALQGVASGASGAMATGVYTGSQYFAGAVSPAQSSNGATVNRTSSQYAVSGASYTSTGQIATFTTPSGAVVSWSGQLLSGPTH